MADLPVLIENNQDALMDYEIVTLVAMKSSPLKRDLPHLDSSKPKKVLSILSSTVCDEHKLTATNVKSILGEITYTTCCDALRRKIEDRFRVGK